MTCFLNLLSDDLLNVLHASSLWGPVRPRVLRVLTATRESDQLRLQWLLVQAARVVLSGGNGGVRDTSIIWFLVDCDLRSIFISTIIWLWRQGVTSLSKVAFSRS